MRHVFDERNWFGGELAQISHRRAFCCLAGIAAEQQNLWRQSLVEPSHQALESHIGGTEKWAANLIKVNVEKSAPLHRFGMRLLHEKDKSAAVVAIAGKIARIIWCMVREQKPFEQQSLADYEAYVRTQTVKRCNNKSQS